MARIMAGLSVLLLSLLYTVLVEAVVTDRRKVLGAIEPVENTSSHPRKEAATVDDVPSSANDVKKLASGAPAPSPSEGYGGKTGHGSGSSGSSGESGEHHATPSSVSVAIALMLMGMTAVVMSVFYLVNFPDENIQRITWHCLSTTIAIFCAVLAFTATKFGMVVLIGEAALDHEGDIPDLYTCLLASSRFALCYFIFQLLLIVLHRYREPLKATAHLGSHVAGFAAIEGFGDLLEHYCGAHPILGWIGVVVAGFGILLVCLGGRAMRRFALTFGQDFDEDSQANEFYHEMCHDGELQFVSLAFGFLVSIAVRQTITGTMPPIHGSPYQKSQFEIWSLFGSAWFMEFLLILIVVWRHSDDHMKRRGYSENIIYISRMGMRLSAMTAGWLFMFWGTWVFWARVGDTLNEEDMMIARTVLALLFSMTSFASFFVLNRVLIKGKLSPVGAKGLIASFALVMGLSWESVFQCAITSVSTIYEHSPSAEVLCDVGLSAFLLVIVLPAWVLYILPKTENDDIDDAGDSSIPDSRPATKERTRTSESSAKA